MEICAKEYKAEEKSQKNKRIILMWDPDLIFDTSKNYFTEHVGERVLAPTWGGYKDNERNTAIAFISAGSQTCRNEDYTAFT